MKGRSIKATARVVDSKVRNTRVVAIRERSIREIRNRTDD